MILLLLALAAQDDSWFPLERGSTWTYASPGGRVTRTVLGVSAVRGVPCAVVRTGATTEWLSVDREGLRLHRVRDANGDAEHEPPATLLRLPLVAGDRGSSDALEYSVGRPESVRAGGKSYDALRVTVTTSIGGVRSTTESWYARGVGLVKRARGSETLELLEAKVAKPPGYAGFRRSGIRLSDRDWSFRDRDFQHKWGNTIAEVALKDGDVDGVLCLHFSNMPAKEFAEWRRRSWKDAKDSRAGRGEPVRVSGAEAYRQEFAIEWDSGTWRYVSLVVRRGSRDLELILWCAEAAWEERRDAMIRFTEALEFERVWTCTDCGTEAAPGSDSCASCGRGFAPPNADLARWSRRTGIQVITDPSPKFPFHCASGNVVGARPPLEADVRRFCDILAREVAKYPQELFAKLELERIVLAREVRRDGGKFGGMAIYDDDLILFEIEQGRELRWFHDQTVHHELFHYIDYRDDGTYEKDDAWERLNPDGFRYDPGREGWWGFDEKDAGFLNTYSQTGLGEDKAEVYGHTVTRGQAMAERARKDPVIAKKVERIKKLVREYHSQLDEEFWRSLDR